MSDYTAHFSKAEMACKCGCGDFEMDKEFLNSLENLRILFNRRMIITSAKRCQDWNAKVGGSKNSEHCLGNAVDVHVENAQERFKLVSLAIVARFRGIGIHKDFVHLDMRKGEKVIFLYD